MFIFKMVFIIICFFRRDALKEQFGKEPSTVRCLAVKSALLGTRTLNTIMTNATQKSQRDCSILNSFSESKTLPAA